MAATRSLYLLALAGTCVFHMYYTEWFSWFALMLLLALPVLSLLLSLPAILSARLTLTGETAVFRGGTITPRLCLQAKFPVGRCFVCLSGSKDVKKKSRRLFLSMGEQALPALSAQHCGIAETKLTKARLLDYLGLFSFPIVLPPALVTEIHPLPSPPAVLPDVTDLLSPPLRPKTGGGFSEIHELRPYRPGDAMRDIHWKLSVKTDELIVREAQDELRTEAILSLRLDGPGPLSDSVLDQLSFLSQWLLEKELVHTVWCFCGEEDPVSAPIRETEDLRRLLSRLVRKLMELPPQQSAVPPVPTSVPGAWCYPIVPAQKEDAP